MHLRTLLLLLGCVIGIVLGEKSLYGSEIATVTFVLGCAQIISFFFEKKLKMNSVRYEREDLISRRSSLFSLSLLSGIFFLAISLSLVRVQFVQEKNNFVCHEACNFEATVITTPTIAGDYQMLLIRPHGVADVYDVQVRAPLYPRYEAGDTVSLFGKVTTPKVSMPHGEEKVFDYTSYLRIHGVGSEMFYPKIELIPLKKETGIVYRLRLWREGLVGVVARYVSEPSASLANGILFGATSMSKELLQTFRVVGLSHVIVLSGFNIAILISAVLLILKFFPLVLRVIFAAAFVVAFVVMVGGEASVVRATLMAAVSLLALLLGRAYVARQALLVSFLVIILYEPDHLLTDVSLHLSFLATAGLVYMSDGFTKLLSRVPSKTYQEIFSTTLAAYLATLPYVMYTFGTASLYSLVTNLIVLPLVPVMMLITFLIIPFAYIAPFFASLLGYADTFLGDLIIFIARLIERLPLASISVSISFITMLLLYGVIVIGYYFTTRSLSSKNNETLLTKEDGILSEIIPY